jgi:hypothetical protein
MRCVICLSAASFLLLAPLAARGGPNQGGTLVVHDTNLTYCDDLGEFPSPAPTCAGVDNQLPTGQPPPGSMGWIWKVYAAFPELSAPRLKALPMGATFPADVIVLGGGLPDPSLDFEITQGGWPAVSGGGAGISFGVTQTDPVVECYWFAGYSYDSPTAWSLALHPTQEMFFVDDSSPPLEDPIAALGSIGFGQPGDTPCPQAQETGACCVGDSECRILTPEECAQLCGVYLGPDYDCEPNPCSMPWGACCFVDGTCEMMSLMPCEVAGGVFVGGCCDPNPCPIVGACCLGSDCYMTTGPDCEAMGGVFMHGQECSTNPCGTPVDPMNWGRVKHAFQEPRR